MTTKITVETPKFIASRIFQDQTSRSFIAGQVEQVLEASASIDAWTVTATARPQDKR